MNTSRLTDMISGVCSCHQIPISVTGIIVQSSQDSNAGSLGIARLLDQVVATCGHTAIIITSSNTVRCNSIGVARVTDQIAGCVVGVIIQGEPTVNTGD